MTNNTLGKIGAASLIMMASVFLSRLAGLLREMVIAYKAGAGAGVDAYQISFVIPEILNHVVASGFLSVTFIPIFTAYLEAGEETKGYEVFSNIINVFGVFLICLLGISLYFTPELVNIFAPGIKDPHVFQSAVHMTRIILPAQLFFFMGGMLMAVQFANERFFIPALAPVIYNGGIIFGGIFLEPYFGTSGFSWGVLIGAFMGNFAVQLYGASKCGMRFIPVFKPFDKDLKKYILLTLPLMLGLTMTFSTEIFFKFFGSYLNAGGIAALNYGLRIMFLLVGFFGQAVGTASFPYLSRLAAQNDIKGMNALINQTLKYLALVTPFSIFMIVFKRETVFILFKRGAFDLQALDLTAGLLTFFMIGAFAFAAQTVVVRGFYAVQNTLVPAIFSSVAVAVAVPVYMAGLNWYGPSGVAFGVSFSAYLQVGILYAVWNKRTANKEAVSVYLFFLKTVLFSIPLYIVLVFTRRLLLLYLDPALFTGVFSILMISGVFFIVIIIVAAYVFNISELMYVITGILKKIGIKLKKN